MISVVQQDSARLLFIITSLLLNDLFLLQLKLHQTTAIQEVKLMLGKKVALLSQSAGTISLT